MKVLLVTGSLPPLRCGVGDYCMHLAAALARHPEAQVTVLTSSAVGEIPAAPRLRVLPVMRDWGLREAVRLPAQIAVEEAQHEVVLRPDQHA